MPKDAKVQSDAVPEGTESPTEEAPTEEAKTEEQPFTEAQQAKLQEMIAQTKTEAEQAGYVKGSREMQGKKDREVAQAQRDSRYYQTLVGSYETGLGPENPDAEVIKLRARDAAHTQSAGEEIRRQQEKVMIDAFEGTLTEHVTDLGIDPDDKRLDWGGDLPSDHLQARQAKFLKSVSKIQKEDASAAEGKRSQEIKDVEDRLRKELGIDSVDTSASGGAVVAGSFAKIEQDYADGKISTAEYEKAMEKRK